MGNLQIRMRAKNYFKECLNFIKTKSLKAAAREQKFDGLIKKLMELVPDISDQYSSVLVEGPLLNIKIRNMHAFQISLVDKVINKFARPVIVDIGDSAGTHVRYIMKIYENRKIRSLSVNIDEKSIERINKKGLSAIYAKAEDLDKYMPSDADIVLCFQMLEHLLNPSKFLHELSARTSIKYLIISVPYLKSSRVGLHHIRSGSKEELNADNTHIFELSPGDWKMLMKHAGWDVVEEKIYFQYPRRGFWRITKPIWKKYDFEGFYGVILRRDATWSSRYKDWQ